MRQATDRVGQPARARRRALWAGALVGACALAGWAVMLPDPAVRSSLKVRARALDEGYLGGTLRRLYHRGQVSSIPRTMRPAPEGAYSWLGTAPFLPVAHALGPYLFAGPNSVPTFRRGLEMGFRLFEVDLALTTDGRLICYHGSDATRELSRLTYPAYLDTMRVRGVEPCRFEELITLAREHPEVRFVLDVKNHFDQVYATVRAEAVRAGVGRSFIPQLYEFSQLDAFRREPVLAGEIFTSYKSVLTNEEIFAAARRLGVRAVTLTLERFYALGDRVPTDLAVMTHAVDDPGIAVEIRRLGARGIYTSYLAPGTVPELYRSWSASCGPATLLSCDTVALPAHVSAPRPRAESSRYSP